MPSTQGPSAAFLHVPVGEFFLLKTSAGDLEREHTAHLEEGERDSLSQAQRSRTTGWKTSPIVQERASLGVEEGGQKDTEM